MTKGQIIKVLAGFYYVDTGEKVVSCKARGKFRNRGQKPLVGDFCSFQEEKDGSGYILSLDERHNQLERPPICNIDQALLVFSIAEPDFDQMLLDQFLAMVEYEKIKPIIIITKIDLNRELVPVIKKKYNAYDLYFVSSKENEGIEEIKPLLKNRVTVVTGQSGVGKSSLLNALLEEEKAIVTDVKGTTRDIVEGSILVGGVKLNLIDTAGVRKSDDIVEKIGIEKSLNLIDEAELVLLILDASCPLSEEDKYLLEKTKEKKRIIIMNKIDLKLNNSYMDDVIKISAKNNEGIDAIKDSIKEMFNVGTFMSKNLTFFTNVRQISLLKSAIKSLENVEQGIKEEREIDMIEIDLKLVWEKLGDIIGANYTEELIDNLFSRFCLGK